MNDRLGPGGNNPPDMMALGNDTADNLNAFLKENPVIENHDQAKVAKGWVDSVKLTIKDLEAERDSKVRPLNEQVERINEQYRPVRELLKGMVNALAERVATFIAAEERRRILAAENAARLAREAEQRARDLAEAERATLAEADEGVLDVDVKAVVERTDNAIEDARKAQRAALVAERETKVKIGGGFGRSLSLRASETLIVTDAEFAIRTMGVTADIEAAIIKSARAFRKLHNELPPGVKSETERKL